MKSNKCKLGDIITQRREKNNEENLPICGVTREGFIPPKQKDADTSLYNVFYKKDFVFNPARMELNSIVYNNIYDKAICSSLYEVFYVSRPDIVLPEFLALIVKQNWFTRYCEFLGSGSAREYCRVANISQIEINYPSIEEQRKIIKGYKTITDRITLKKKINDNLEATAQAYFDNLFFDNSEPDCTLADIALVNPIRQLAKGTEARCFDMATLPTNGCIPTGDVIKPYNGGVRFINGDTLIARITPCLENGKAAYINILSDNEVAFGSTEYIVFAAKDNMPSSFYYFLIRNAKFVAFALQFMNGSSGRQRVSGEELASFPLVRPSAENLAAFDKVGAMVLEQMKENTSEIQKLKQLQEIIVATISRR